MNKKSDNKEKNLSKKMEKSSKEYQYQEFEKLWEQLFSKENDKLEKIKTLEYENFYIINNALGRLDKTLKICKYLEGLSR